MRCIQNQATLLPLHTWQNHQRKLGCAKLLWLSTSKRIKSSSMNQHHHISPGTSCKAMSDYNAIVLGVTSPAKSGGDISVLLPVGGFLILFYLFANFIVPKLIVDEFVSKTATEDEEEEQRGF